MIILSSILDLVPPLVTVMTDGNSTAGEVFSLMCKVVSVEGVRSEGISIMWSGPNGTIQNGGYLMIEDHTTTGSVTLGRLVSLHCIHLTEDSIPVLVEYQSLV